MKLLIIEDDPRKCEAVLTLVGIHFGTFTLEVARSYQSGLKAVIATAPDILILDMSIPNFDAEPGQRSGKPRPLGGFEILRKIRRRRLTTKAIVLTQLDHFGDGGQEYGFRELEEKCYEEFPETFLGAIYYSQSSADWRDRLKESLMTAVRAS